MIDLTRSFEATIDDVIPGERSVVAKINTDAIDRYRTLIVPQGAKLDAYRRNPVVLWEHGRDPARGTMPIGKNNWIKTSARGIVAKTVFRDDAYSDMLFKAYQDGGLRGWSVRMVNPEYSPPSKEEVRSRPELEGCEFVFRSWELGEYSATALPGNPDTLTILASRGIWLPDDVRTTTDAGPALGTIKPKAKGGKEDEEEETDDEDKKQAAKKWPDGRTAPYVEQDGLHWYVCEPTGNRVARYDDERVALRCLAALDVVRPRYTERVQTSVMEIRAWADDQIMLAVEKLNLKLTGRI